MKVFALYNFKGGVGKTATAVELAYRSTLEDARTLIWDLDPQGAASFYFRIKSKIQGGGKKLLEKKNRLHLRIRGTDFEGLELVPADFSYRHMDLVLDATKRPTARLGRLLEPLAEEYEYVFFDCPPSISLTSESVFAAAQVLLVPTIPTPLSLRTLEQLHQHLEREGPRDLRVWPFFCMVDRRKSLHRTICDQAAAGPYEMLATRIPYASEVEQMGVHRQPLALYASGAPASRAYAALWAEIRERLRVP